MAPAPAPRPHSLALVAGLGLLLTTLAGPTPAVASVADPLADTTRFYAPAPDPGAQQQAKQLRTYGQVPTARRLQAMAATPQAVWFSDGTPTTVSQRVAAVVSDAARTGSVPTLVLYNVPGRDCWQYSSGGASTDAAYRAWVDGVAAGLRGAGRAVVVVEPDGLANLPSDCPSAYPGRDADAMTEGRHADLRYAAAKVRAADPEALVYLDAGHSAWHGVGEIAERLDQAGVRDVQGFSLNVSNFQPTAQLLQYGSWIAKCLYYVANPADGGARLGRYDQCASQYSPATFGEPATWSRTDAWYAANVDAAADPPTGPDQLAHFVLDTGRNGRGAWTPRTGYPDPQDWCNPPGRGLGLRPSTRTGSALADAYLWVKTPGQSDGQCDRGGAGGTDPAWGGVRDPAAGAWFPEQAQQLVRLAAPPLRPQGRG